MLFVRFSTTFRSCPTICGEDFKKRTMARIRSCLNVLKPVDFSHCKSLLAMACVSLAVQVAFMVPNPVTKLNYALLQIFARWLLSSNSDLMRVVLAQLTV